MNPQRHGRQRKSDQGWVRATLNFSTRRRNRGDGLFASCPLRGRHPSAWSVANLQGGAEYVCREAIHHF